MLDKLASTDLHVAAPSSAITAATKAFVSSPSAQLNKAAHADSVKLVSSKISGYAAGQAKIFSYPPFHEEVSLAAVVEMEPNFDQASAGFLDVLNSSTASMTGSSYRGALSACNENSLNLLDRWEMRRQHSSDLRGMMKTKMLQEEKARSGKRMHLQQGTAAVQQESESGDRRSFYSQAAMAERCSSLREETSKLMLERGSS